MSLFAPRPAGILAAILVLILCAALMLLAVTACGSTTDTTAGATSATGATAALTTTVTVVAPTTDAGQTADEAAVTFGTDDGVTLSGHLFGSGSSGVILTHMYPADQTSWREMAKRLAGEGYLVLTFDFRGYGESGGDKEIDKIARDVTAAVNFVREEGTSEVVLAGASMGGTACLVAGEQAQNLSSIRLAGIAALSAPVEFRGLSAAAAVPKIVVPLLFISAEDDEGAAGAQQLQQLAAGKGDLHILPGGDHGTALLGGDQADEVYRLLSDFIRTSLGT